MSLSFTAAARWWLSIAIAVFVLLAPAGTALAHDTPGELRVHAFARPQADRLHVVLRIPLALLLNIDLPKQGPGYLALGQIDEGLARAVAAADKDVQWLENGRRLTLAASRARISAPGDTSFGSFDSALALVQGPRLPATAYVFWNQGYFDAHLEYPIESAGSEFALDFAVAPGLRDRLKLDLRFQGPGSAERAYELATANGPVILDPRWHRAAMTFVQSGFEHILLGPDHLLFLLCLVLPFRRVDVYLVGVITAFTLAHSVTLIGAAYGLAPAAPWFAPLVEALIAASILYMAIENVLAPQLRRRWLASALFGLVHGFGFSFMLQAQLQFAGSNLLVSLLAFNVGVELGQLLVLFALLPTLVWLRGRHPASGTALDIVVCALAGHVAWHWMVERGSGLWSLAEMAPERLAAALGWLLFAAALGWGLKRALLRGRQKAIEGGRSTASSPSAARADRSATG